MKWIPRAPLAFLPLAAALSGACGGSGDDDGAAARSASGGRGGAAGGQAGGSGGKATGGTTGSGGSTGGKGGAGGGANGGTSGSGTGGGVTGGAGGSTGGAGGSTGGAGGAAGKGGAAAGKGGAGGTGGAGGGSGGAGGASGDGGASGSSGAPGTPGIHFVGRVDDEDPQNVRFAWSGTGFVARFNGTSAKAMLSGGQDFTVVVDGAVQPKLVAMSGMNVLATGLDAGEHVVEVYRRVEANQGVSTFMGLDLGSGTLLAPPVPTRRLEFIGDSITCGYGDEGADMNCSFTPQTENHYLAYESLTARALDAELSTVAWSGKGVVCNYGDASDACQDPLPTYYDLTLPDDATSKWDFSRFVPDAVVINLGTNDFSTTTDPTAADFENGYKALLTRVRTAYPDAYILCTNGPMLSGNELTTVMTDIEAAVSALGDSKISTFDIPPQDGSDGYGCDWHPSLARHQKMATIVTAELKAKLGW